MTVVGLKLPVVAVAAGVVAVAVVGQLAIVAVVDQLHSPMLSMDKLRCMLTVCHRCRHA